jgi:hypothetical protein
MYNIPVPLKTYVLIPDVLTEMFAVASRAQLHHATDRQVKLETLHAEKRKLAGKIANLTSAIAERGHSAALLARLTQLETELSTIKLEIKQWETVQIAPVPVLSETEIIQLSQTLQDQLTFSAPFEVRAKLMEFIHEIKVYKTPEKDIAGYISYYLPGAPPFDIPLPQGTGYNLPIEQSPMGAPRYRQIFTHPICPKQKPHSQ